MSDVLSHPETALLGDFAAGSLSGDDLDRVADLLTSTGIAVGTPAYMAPEQASKGSFVGLAADIYDLGAMLNHLITGRSPFLADIAFEMLQALASAEPVTTRRLRRLPRDLERR
jgi:serine/threonine protein kinase